MAVIIKITLMVLNGVFMAVGLALLGYSIFLAVSDEGRDIQKILNDDSWTDGSVSDDNSSDEVVDIIYQIIAYTLITVSSVIVIIGLLGFFGALFNIRGLLICQMVLVSITLLIQILSLTGISIVYTKIDLSQLDDTLKKEVKNDYESETSLDSTSQKWNFMQTRLRCCGSSSYTDYQDSEFEKNSPDGVYVPYTCCVLKDDASLVNVTKDDVLEYDTCQDEAREEEKKPSQLHSKGCYTVLEDKVNFFVFFIIGILSTIIAIQIATIVFSCIFCCKKQNKVASSGK